MAVEKAFKAQETASGKACLQHSREATVTGLEQVNIRRGQREDGGRARMCGILLAIVDLGFYSERNGEPVEGFEQRDDVTCLHF